MKRQSLQYCIKEPALFRSKALAWASTFTHCSYFNPNDIYDIPYGPFNELLTAGALDVLCFNTNQRFEYVKEFHRSHRDWLIGFFGYDLKNETESLVSRHRDLLAFPDIDFYVPEHLLFFTGNTVRIESTEDPHLIISSIENTIVKQEDPVKINITSKVDVQEYIQTIQRLKNHILEGDIYEINYCVPFYAENVKLSPVTIYQKLNAISPTPFSVFHKFNNNYLICASPERFLKKIDTKLISQPIKGTAKRGNSVVDDQRIKEKLRSSEKEKAENMMIVDLVRNDLAKSARPGTVKVEEMFGIYTFRQLHQMISTVTAELREEIHFIDAIKNAFPMGSMTGAPKVKVMQLIDHYEEARRGLYSGAMGYITPGGDFDFNVVIRSLLYNKSLYRLSFEVGSAITFDALPEQEYEECLLKAKALMNVLGVEQTD